MCDIYLLTIYLYNETRYQYEDKNDILTSGFELLRFLDELGGLGVFTLSDTGTDTDIVLKKACYRPPTKLQEGIVFTGVCHSFFPQGARYPCSQILPAEVGYGQGSAATTHTVLLECFLV